MREGLHGAALWDEVKDRLHDSALALSGGQQQRLCIARALAVEPGNAADGRAGLGARSDRDGAHRGADLQLKRELHDVIVTHNMQQAARVSDFTAFFCLGELIEFDETSRIFTNPGEKATEDYITGRYG